MRWSIGTMAVMAVTAFGAAAYGFPANAQQIEPAPLPPVAPAPQVAQSPGMHHTTQDCVNLPTPEQQTDCLNEVSSQGDYMPTPRPAPGSQMPMEYRLPLGTREVPPLR
ncbi:MAG TPA: hypothetical protein VMQ11_19585 [Alphaproteobacteria bacterium]|nr:hypothetical protein [Alphaproteobacteria bacterium]